jgi:predicted secreted hydrolase
VIIPLRIIALVGFAFWFANLDAASPIVAPGYRIELPRDGGSHPEFATEWWYLTGWLKDEHGSQRGFQITFFRSRNAAADDNPSSFSPRQILFAHAALSDPTQIRLLRDERTARAGFGLAEARQESTNVSIDDWSLRADGPNLVAQVATEAFSLALKLQSTQPVLLQGDRGYSRKGPDPSSASYYYSLPQLDVHGSIAVHGAKFAVTGKAWFDHEWFNEYVHAEVANWDWVGLNLNNGDALMAFRMRDGQGRQRWAGGARRDADKTQSFSAEQIFWTPLRHWRSPRTGVEYPIVWRLKLGTQEIILQPLMDDQESDARASVGILYWEGAVKATDLAGAELGSGYLELTGYGEPVRL